MVTIYAQETVANTHKGSKMVGYRETLCMKLNRRAYFLIKREKFLDVVGEWQRLPSKRDEWDESQLSFWERQFELVSSGIRNADVHDTSLVAYERIMNEEDI